MLQPQKKPENGHILPGGKNDKNEGTLFSQTFKVEEKKVALVLLILASFPSYSHFLIS